MSSRSKRFCACYLQVLKKVPCVKMACFGSPVWIPMIQPPFCSTYVALQYETGMKLFHRAVTELHDIKAIHR